MRSTFWLRLSVLANVIFALAIGAIFARRFVISRSDGGARVYAEERRTLFAALPRREGGTVLVGDSLTDRCEWAELLGDASVRNRGVAGDTTRDVLGRVADIVAMKPGRVLLMVGVNDLAAGEPIADIVARYIGIVDALRRGAPEAAIFCQSVLPVRDEQVAKPLSNDAVIALNEILGRATLEHGCTYVDVRSALLDPTHTALDGRFTLDGLHLNGAGYVAWAAAIAPLLHAPR